MASLLHRFQATRADVERAAAFLHGAACVCRTGWGGPRRGDSFARGEVDRECRRVARINAERRSRPANAAWSRGYEAVAARLGVADKSGNILASCPEEPDLLFRYRCLCPDSRRQFLRGDRTLAIRLPSYAHVAPQALCDSNEDVVRLVRRGRVRYLVTCVVDAGERDDRPADMVMAHKTARSLSKEFSLLEEFPLLVDFGGRGRRYRIFVWEYRGPLPEGPSEVPVVIPTAGLEL